MKELTDAQKLSVWTKLSQLVGLSKEVQVKLSDYTLKDGSTITVNDETLEVSGAQDGEVELEDGRILVITEGKLETIKDAPEAPVEAADEVTPEDAPAEPTVEALQAENDSLRAEIEALKAELDSAKASEQELSTELSAIKDKPADKKVVLSASTNHEAKSPAQQAWERYKSK